MGEETTRSLSDATIYVGCIPMKRISTMPDTPEFISAVKKEFCDAVTLHSLETIELIADIHSNALMCVVCGLRIGKKMRWRNALLAADRMRKCLE